MNPKPEHEHLSAWLDGELPDAEIAELEAELERDPALRAELDALEQVVSFVRQEGPSQAPLGLHRDIMARIDEEFPQRTSSWTSALFGWLRRPGGIPLEGWVLAAAAAAVLLLLLPDWKEGPSTELEEKELSPAALEVPKPLVEKDPLAIRDDLEKPPAPGPVKVIGRASTESKPRKGSEKVALEAVPAPAMPVPAVPEPAVSEGQGTAEEVKPAPSPSFEIPAAPEADVRYVIESSDPEMKLKVLRMASHFGGARNLQKQAVADARMGSSMEELVISVRQTDLIELNTKLQQLGYEVQREDQGNLVPGGKIEVRLTLSLTQPDEAMRAAPPSPAEAPAAE